MHCVNPNFDISFGYQQYICLFWDTIVWGTQTHSDWHEQLLMILIGISFNMQKHLYNKLRTLCMRVHNIFRSEISRLIFITYLDPQVSFQADLWRGHAHVSRLIWSVWDKRSITVRTHSLHGTTNFVASVQKITSGPNKPEVITEYRLTDL